MTHTDLKPDEVPEDPLDAAPSSVADRLKQFLNPIDARYEDLRPEIWHLAVLRSSAPD
jgi:hypothetical protein